LFTTFKTGLWLVLAVAVAYAATPQVFALDDTYIVQHSARVLLTGEDPAYGSSALVGATSPPYVALVALLLLMRLPAVHLATALGLVAFSAGLWALGRTLRLSATYTALFVVLCLGSGFTLTNSLNGIETGWAFAAVTWLIVFVLRDVPIGIACLAGLLPAIRPDLGPTAALVLGYALWNRTWSERARLVAIAAAAALPWFLWVRVDTGHWLPQTMRAKQFWFAEACWPFDRKLWTASVYIRRTFWQIVPLAASMLLLARLGLGRIGLVATLVTFATYVVLAPGTLYYNYFRYPYAIVLPWACFGLAYLMSLELISRRLRHVVVGLTSVFVLWTQVQSFLEIRQSDARDAQELVDVATWLDANVPREAVVMIHDAGVVSELANRRLVDMVGLKSPESIEAHQRWTFPSCGENRREALVEIARRSGASYLVVVDRWDSVYRIARSVQEAGFSLTRLRYPPHRPGFSVYHISDQALARTGS
jgi:hypothetical protein